VLASVCVDPGVLVGLQLTTVDLAEPLIEPDGSDVVDIDPEDTQIMASADDELLGRADQRRAGTTATVSLTDEHVRDLRW